jgi:hypothetical protein
MRQRALAAQVLGYVSDKQAVVGDLVQAMSDPFDDVRNNAMRALLVFVEDQNGNHGKHIYAQELRCIF